MAARAVRATDMPAHPGTSCWPPSMSTVAPVTAVLTIRCTASAAMSAGPTTRPMGRADHPPDGERGPELVAACAEPGAEQRCRQRGVDEAGGDEVDPDRRHLDREVGDQGGQRGGAGRDERPARPWRAPAGAAHEQQRAAGPHPAHGVLRHGDGQPQVRIPVPVRPVPVQLGQRRVVRPGAGDQHMVDHRGQAGEEQAERGRVGGVEGGGAARAHLGCGGLEAAGVAGGQDHAGALGARPAGGLQADAGAAADHDDGLPGQFRFAPGAGDGCVRGHGCFLVRRRPGV